jgi:hypothetical protein
MAHRLVKRNFSRERKHCYQVPEDPMRKGSGLVKRRATKKDEKTSSLFNLMLMLFFVDRLEPR